MEVYSFMFIPIVLLAVAKFAAAKGGTRPLPMQMGELPPAAPREQVVAETEEEYKDYFSRLWDGLASDDDEYIVFEVKTPRKVCTCDGCKPVCSRRGASKYKAKK